MDKSFVYFKITSKPKDIKTNDNIFRREYSNKSIFDPDEITKILGVQPSSITRKGGVRKWIAPNGEEKSHEYKFSSWTSEKLYEDKNKIDTAQWRGISCLAIDVIAAFKNKIAELRKIKELYDVEYCLVFVPFASIEVKIEDNEIIDSCGDWNPGIHIYQEVVEFCGAVGASIDIDTYVNLKKYEELTVLPEDGGLDD